MWKAISRSTALRLVLFLLGFFSASRFGIAQNAVLAEDGMIYFDGDLSGGVGSVGFPVTSGLVTSGTAIGLASLSPEKLRAGFWFLTSVGGVTTYVYGTADVYPEAVAGWCKVVFTGVGGATETRWVMMIPANGTLHYGQYGGTSIAGGDTFMSAQNYPGGTAATFVRNVSVWLAGGALSGAYGAASQPTTSPATRPVMLPLIQRIATSQPSVALGRVSGWVAQCTSGAVGVTKASDYIHLVDWTGMGNPVREDAGAQAPWYPDFNNHGLGKPMENLGSMLGSITEAMWWIRGAWDYVGLRTACSWCWCALVMWWCLKMVLGSLMDLVHIAI